MKFKLITSFKSSDCLFWSIVPRFFCTDKSSSYSVVSFYKFKKTEDPDYFVQKLRPELNELSVKGRLYLNCIGINSQICLPCQNLNLVKQLFDDNYSRNINYRVHQSSFQVYNKLRIINKKLVDGMDNSFDPNEVGRHLSPSEWNQILDDTDIDPIILDIRNSYEWKVGRFKRCKEQKMRTFNQFDDYADDIEDSVDKNRKILMYCTGGIRCELFSAKLKKRGFTDVNQLDGGIINYGLQGDTRHWMGNLFVFDDRLVVPVDGEPDSERNDVITKCVHCSVQVETHYNCANTGCNNVFPACHTCAVKYVACCSQECANSENNYIRRNSKQVNLKRSVGKGKHFRAVLDSL